MPSPPTDPRKMEMAWNLHTKGFYLTQIAKKIAKEFDCDLPCKATVHNWVKRAEKDVRYRYYKLLSVESNRKLSAERLRVLWSMLDEGIAQDQILLKDAVELWLKINRQVIDLFGLRVAPGEGAPELPKVDPEIQKYINELTLEDEALA